MGDYLRSLAIRTLSPPGVRPRPRSLYEPARSPFLGTQGNDFPEIEQRIQLRETPAPRIVTNPEPGAEPKVRREGIRAETSTTHASQRIATMPAQEQRPAPSSFPRDDSRAPEAKPLTTGLNLTTPTTVRTETGNLLAEKKPKLVEHTSERIARIDRVEKQTTLHSHETVRLPADTEHRKPIDAPLQRNAATLHESAMPVRPAAPQTLPVTGLNTAAPDIHIAIGRVIVNAGPAPAPRPQTAAAAPTLRLTLDQYLRQRGGRP